MKPEAERYLADGFVLAPGIFTADRVAEARRHAEDVVMCRYETGCPPNDRNWHPGDDPDVLRKIDQANRCDGGDFFDGNVDRQKALLRAGSDEPWEETSAVLTAGDVSFHHSTTIHGSGPNSSGRPRWSIAVHLRTETCRLVPDAPRQLVEQLDDPIACPRVYP